LISGLQVRIVEADGVIAVMTAVVGVAEVVAVVVAGVVEEVVVVTTVVVVVDEVVAVAGATTVVTGTTAVVVVVVAGVAVVAMTDGAEVEVEAVAGDMEEVSGFDVLAILALV